MITDILNEAKTLGACKLTNTGRQSWEDLIRLYFSPQGLEFCTDKNFPSLQLWTKINSRHNLSEYGIFIGGTKSHCTNLPYVALIGGVSHLEYNCIGKYTIVLQHGAKAFIKASNYAVLNIIDIGECGISFEMDDTARVL